MSELDLGLSIALGVGLTAVAIVALLWLAIRWLRSLSGKPRPS